MFIGVTPGYYNPRLTVEDIRDHFEELRTEAGYTVPNSTNEELAILMAVFEQGAVSPHPGE